MASSPDSTVNSAGTRFDTFSPAAHHGYTGGTAESRKNRETLRAAMVAEGFTPNRMEWWHYDLPQPTRYPVLDLPFVGDGRN